MFVVIMFEYQTKGDKKILGRDLTPVEQVNEVFGPFTSEKDVDDWIKLAEHKIKDRHWLIIPLENPNNLFIVERN